MSKINLTPIDVGSLDVATDIADLHRDLHVFIDFIREQEVKRATRSNKFGKADARRLAKLLTDENALAEISDIGYSTWIDFVDKLALGLGFIQHDTQKRYGGYSSAAPSFQDNEIRFDAEHYQAFMRKSLAQQEQLIFDTLIDTYRENEFLYHSPMGRLNQFATYGTGLGVLPTIDFKAVRRFLFKLLASCQSGTWYTVASLVTYLKTEHPYFLIPRHPNLKSNHEKKMGRYGNFHEGNNPWLPDTVVKDDAPDGFERVEGRYIERFLESIPLLAGYVDVAYAAKAEMSVYPLRNYLQAFRIHDHFLRFMQGNLGEPNVTVQPNYEIHVESPLYPAKVLAELEPLTELVHSDRVTVFKLNRRKVTSALAHDTSLDVVKLLTRLNGRALPQNIQIEIEEWAGHSENFVLYDGFGLFESDKETLPIADPFTVERITPTLRIVRTPEMLFHQLEQAEEIPLRISHSEKALRTLPPEATTLFRTQAKVVKEAKPKAQALNLLRKTLVTLHFPNQTALDDLHQALVNARCPVQSDRANLTLTYASQYDAQVTATFKKLADRYAIKIEEIEAKA